MRIRATLAAAVVLTASIALTGCFGDGPNVTHDEDDQSFTYEMDQLYVNPDTGKITKYIDSLGETVFNEGFSKKDVDLRSDSTARAFLSAPTALSAHKEITIEGKPYPASVVMYWSWKPLDMPAAIARYNELYTSQEDTFSVLSAYDVRTAVQVFDSRVLTQAVITADIASTVEFAVRGKTTREADSHVGDSYLAGEPAWKAWEAMTGKSTSMTNYDYLHLCATYEVEVGNMEAVLAAVKALPEAAGLLGFSDVMSPLPIQVETEVPCTVVQVPNPYEGKSYSETGSSYNG